MNRLTFLALALGLVACGSSQSTSTTPAEPIPAEPTMIPAEPAAATEPAAPAEPPAPPPVPDAVTAAPEVYKVLVDNETVRALEVTVAPAGKTPMHQHPDHFAYAISPAKMKFTNDQGASQEAELKAGQAMMMPAGAHSGENIGAAEMKAFVVELKKAGTAAPAGDDPLKAGGKIYKSVFENEKGRIFEVSFAKKAKIAMHAHPDHLVYVLTPGKIEITGADGKAQAMDLTAGMAVFLPAQAHSAKNIGKTAFKLLVVEIR